MAMVPVDEEYHLNVGSLSELTDAWLQEAGLHQPISPDVIEELSGNSG
jgi:hypothetical protein